jgi:hypothetical protein
MNMCSAVHEHVLCLFLRVHSCHRVMQYGAGFVQRKQATTAAFCRAAALQCRLQGAALYSAHVNDAGMFAYLPT